MEAISKTTLTHFDPKYIGTEKYCKERVHRQLEVYEQWLDSRQNALSLEEAADLEQLLKSGDYSFNELLTDFNLLVENDGILGFGDDQKESVCDGASCFIVKRHHRPRDRQNDNALFFVENAAKGMYHLLE